MYWNISLIVIKQLKLPGRKNLGNGQVVARFGSREGIIERGPKIGTGGRTRTATLSPELDFESNVSTNFTTPAGIER